MMHSRLKRARGRIEALRLALLSPMPEELGTVLPGLEEAARFLGEMEEELRDGAYAPDEVRRELKMLQNDLRISTRLIEQGLQFCRGWAKLIGAEPAYTLTGRAAPPSAKGTLSLRG